MKAEHPSSWAAVEAGARDAGRVVRLKPVSEEAAFRMAALVREFPPCQCSVDADSDVGTAGVPLHPSWIDGLVAAGVESVLPRCFIRRLEIVHNRPVCRDEPLEVEMEWSGDSAGTGLYSVSFRVVSPGSVAAEGTALVERAPRRDPEQPQ